MEFIYLPSSLKEALTEQHPDLKSLDMETVINSFSTNDLNLISIESNRIKVSLARELGYLVVDDHLTNLVGERAYEFDLTDSHRPGEKYHLEACVTKDFKLILYTCESPHQNIVSVVLEALAEAMPVAEFIKSKAFAALH